MFKTAQALLASVVFSLITPFITYADSCVVCPSNPVCYLNTGSSLICSSNTSSANEICCGANPGCLEDSFSQVICGNTFCGNAKRCSPNVSVTTPQIPPSTALNTFPIVHVQVGDSELASGVTSAVQCESQAGRLGINSSDPNNTSVDCLRLKLTNPGVYSSDFRFCLYLNSKYVCTPWASEGGGISKIVASPNQFSYTGFQVETRTATAGRTFTNVVASVQLYSQNSNGTCGILGQSAGVSNVVTTAGQLSDWAFINGDDSPGCARVFLGFGVPGPVVTPTPIATVAPPIVPTVQPTPVGTPIAGNCTTLNFSPSRDTLLALSSKLRADIRGVLKNAVKAKIFKSSQTVGYYSTVDGITKSAYTTIKTLPPKILSCSVVPSQCATAPIVGQLTNVVRVFGDYENLSNAIVKKIKRKNKKLANSLQSKVAGSSTKAAQEVGTFPTLITVC